MSREGLSKSTLDRDSSVYEELERSDDLQNMYGCVYVYVNVYVYIEHICVCMCMCICHKG